MVETEFVTVSIVSFRCFGFSYMHLNCCFFRFYFMRPHVRILSPIYTSNFSLTSPLVKENLPTVHTSKFSLTTFP